MLNGWNQEKSRMSSDADMDRHILDEEYFYSMIHSQTRKKRQCLKCRKMFISVSAGNRQCSMCASLNEKYNSEVYVCLQPES